jgi:hypothetical protein
MYQNDAAKWLGICWQTIQNGYDVDSSFTHTRFGLAQQIIA